MAKSNKSKPWQYGDTAPANWKECADVLKGMQKPKRGNPIADRLIDIEKILKDYK